MNTLEELLALRPNWDGYGALAISVEVGERVQAIMAVIAHSPELVPNTNGTITIEWHSTRYDLEIEVGKTRTVIFFEPSKIVNLENMRE